MIKTLIIGAMAAVALAGCSSTRLPPSNTQYVVIEPPAAFMNCPELRSIPDADKLTNAQVAQVIITLDRNNKTCALNMKKIKQFVEENKKLYNKK